MFNRIFKLPEQLSFFLFGSRGTGKSTLLKEVFKQQKVIWFDLLDLDVEARLQSRPMDFETELLARAEDRSIQWVVVDEIQKAPALLDLVHRQIEKKRFRFALTGSSARKLKRGTANLLAGRAIEKFLFPLTHFELGDQFKLDFVLRWGSLPRVFGLSEDERNDYLRTYGNTYLKEEIQAEQIVRNLRPFRSFLEVSSHGSGQIINYSKISRDIGSDPVSVKSYFEILEDTLIGFHLYPFHEPVRKRQRQNPKFYFFDLGVQGALQKMLHVPLEPQTYRFGRAFEQWVIVEIHRLNHYLKKDWTLSYLRTKDDVEVDLIIERPGEPRALIEIKSTERISEDDVRSLARMGKDVPNSTRFCFSLDRIPKIINGVGCLPWWDGLKELGLEARQAPLFHLF